MPQPAIQLVPLVQQYALPAAVAANSVTLPVRPGWRPYTEATRGKRPVYLKFIRNLAGVVAPGTAAPIGIFGCDLTYDSAAFGVNTLGQALPGADPLNSALNLTTGAIAGCYVDNVRVTGGVGAGVGFPIVLNPGSGYNPAAAPAVTFTGHGTAAGTALISPDGRLVGVTITNIGTFSTAGTVTVAGPGAGGTTAVIAVSAGQVTTVNCRIPFATHAPTTPGGAFWMATYKDRIIACSTGLLAGISGANGLDPDQQVVGLSAAGSYTNAGFTVASATHPDGTVAIAQLTLGLGVPNGSFITVYRGLVRQVLAPTAVNGTLNIQIKALDAMWLGGNATAGVTETSVFTSMVTAINN